LFRSNLGLINEARPYRVQVEFDHGYSAKDGLWSDLEWKVFFCMPYVQYKVLPDATGDGVVIHETRHAFKEVWLNPERSKPKSKTTEKVASQRNLDN